MLITSFKKSTLWAFALVMLCVFSTVCLSSVYKIVDENGNVTFSDQAAPGADMVDIKPANSAQPTKTPTTKPSINPLPGTENIKAANYQLAITSPFANSVIANGLVPFNVQVTVSPALIKGHRLQLKIDGKPYATSNNNNLQVNSINRGQHSLQVNAIDSSGLVINSSEIITINALRPH